MTIDLAARRDAERRIEEARDDVDILLEDAAEVALDAGISDKQFVVLALEHYRREESKKGKDDTRG